MNDIDLMLLTLRDEPLPGDLSALDENVLGSLAGLRDRQSARRAMVLAIGLAGFVGLTVGIGAGSPASAEPLLGMPQAAPSRRETVVRRSRDRAP